MSTEGTGSPIVAPADAPVESSESIETTESLEALDDGGFTDGEHSSEAEIDADPTLTKAEKAEAKKTLKKLTLKFNGKEIEEELPFEIPDTPEALEYMQRQLQMSKLAQHKSQEAVNLQKDVVKFVEELRKNPKKVLSDPKWGVDLKKLAAEMIEEEISNASKTPEQLRAEELERELKALKDEREKEAEEFKARELERIQAEQYERYDSLMTQALTKSELPKSPYTVKKMAEYMLLGLQNGIDITPDEVVPLIREEMTNDLKEMFAVMPEEVVESIVGRDTINKLRKKQLAAAKSKPKLQPIKKAVQDVGVSKKTEEKPASKINMKDFFGV